MVQGYHRWEQIPLSCESSNRRKTVDGRSISNKIAMWNYGAWCCVDVLVFPQRYLLGCENFRISSIQVSKIICSISSFISSSVEQSSLKIWISFTNIVLKHITSGSNNFSCFRYEFQRATIWFLRIAMSFSSSFTWEWTVIGMFLLFFKNKCNGVCYIFIQYIYISRISEVVVMKNMRWDYAFGSDRKN